MQDFHIYMLHNFFFFLIYFNVIFVKIIPIDFNLPCLISLDSNSTEDESTEPQVSMEMKEQFMPPQGEAINSQPTGKNILSDFSPLQQYSVCSINDISTIFGYKA